MEGVGKMLSEIALHLKKENNLKRESVWRGGRVSGPRCTPENVLPVDMDSRRRGRRGEQLALVRVYFLWCEQLENATTGMCRAQLFGGC